MDEQKAALRQMDPWVFSTSAALCIAVVIWVVGTDPLASAADSPGLAIDPQPARFDREEPALTPTARP